MAVASTSVFKYGEHESQWVRLTVPPEPWTKMRGAPGEASPDSLPVAVLIHGGYWKQKYTADNAGIKELVPDLCARGFAIMEVEYRRRDDPGGGWPGSNDDCLAALDLLGTMPHEKRLPLDLSRVVIIGHSAGGQLALWVGAKAERVRPRLVVGVAPVCNLTEAYRAKLSDEGDAVELYMHCTPDTAAGEEAYSKACPTKLLPVTVPTLIVQGSTDTDVPAWLSLKYYSDAMAARGVSEGGSGIGAGAPVELLELTGADHFGPLTAGSTHWEALMERVADMMSSDFVCESVQA